ncbi:MAG: transposase [Phycisphaerales bacterium]
MNELRRMARRERSAEQRDWLLATAHAVLIMDQAGWHRSRALNVPDNIAVPGNITVLLPPPYSPELNPVERLWAYLRSHFRTNASARTTRRRSTRAPRRGARARRRCLARCARAGASGTSMDGDSQRIVHAAKQGNFPIDGPETHRHDRGELGVRARVSDHPRISMATSAFTAASGQRG